MKKFFFIIIIACFSLSLKAQQTNQRIDSLLKTIYTDSLPGVSVALIDSGKTVFEKSYGIADLDSHKKLSAQSSFNICSLTKQFTAMGILLLENKHQLSLNDKISNFFPGMNKKVANVVTVKELLTHSSGIIDHYDYVNTENMKHAHNSDVYNAIQNIDSTYFTPGTKFKYSNTAYCLLALIIEKLSGMSYYNYMDKYIFQPAGMKNTIIWNENATIKKQVTAYNYDSSSSTFKRSGPDENIFFSTEGDGGIYTSVDDYIKWFMALQSGKIYPKNIVEKARTIQFEIDIHKNSGYGFGWFVDANNADKKVYHSGSNGGFRTYSFTIPSQNSMIIIFSNRSDIDIETLAQKLAEIEWPLMQPFVKIEALTS